MQLASQPAEIRGFGHVRVEAVEQALVENKRLMEAFRSFGSRTERSGTSPYTSRSRSTFFSSRAF